MGAWRAKSAETEVQGLTIQTFTMRANPNIVIKKIGYTTQKALSRQFLEARLIHAIAG